MQPIEYKNFINTTSRDVFRQWLVENHAVEKECHVMLRRGKPAEGSLCYLDAVEEALCFGWIDCTIRKGENGYMLQQFRPRKKCGTWTQLNIERCRRLERLCLMTDAGRAVMPNTTFSIDTQILERLKEDSSVWQNFCNFPPLYQKIRIDTIQLYMKKYPEQSQKRLEKLIENTRNNIMFGDWNDYGRLL